MYIQNIYVGKIPKLASLKISCFSDNKIYAHLPSWIIDLLGTLKLHYFKRIRDITVQIKQQIYANTRNDKYLENLFMVAIAISMNILFQIIQLIQSFRVTVR